VLAFVAPYLRPEDRAWLARNPDPRIRHLDYDWRLNDVAAEPQGGVERRT
jgi:hypothetical protein